MQKAIHANVQMNNIFPYLLSRHVTQEQTNPLEFESLFEEEFISFRIGKDFEFICLKKKKI